MTVRSTLHDARTRSKDQVKQAREQVIVYNERLADTVTSRIPQIESRLSGRLPSPLEVVERYYDMVGNFYETNRDFVTRLASAWDRAGEDAPAGDGTPVEAEPEAGTATGKAPEVAVKPVAKKAPARKRSSRTTAKKTTRTAGTTDGSPAPADAGESPAS